MQAYINKVERINELIAHERKFSDQILSLEIRQNSFQKEFSAATYKYDKLYLDNLIVPGLIGDFCKFKHLREFNEVKKIIYYIKIL